MAENFPGPYAVDIQYTQAGLTHHQFLNVDIVEDAVPGQDLATLQANTRGGIPQGIIASVNFYRDLIRPLYPATTQLESWTLWKYLPNSFDRIFINTQVIDLPGTSGGAVVTAGQLIMTFRTQEGGVMRLSHMETTTASGASVSRAAAIGTILALFQYVEGATNWVLARDTSYPVAGIAYHPGQSEALFKRRFRSL